jgi:hypothetical protein
MGAGAVLAAHVLTDWPIMQALPRAADRDAELRIYLDARALLRF